MRVFEERHITAAGKLLPFTAFKPFIDLPAKVLSPQTKASLIATGESRLGAAYEMLKATDYMRFVRDGNRSVYEKIHFARRAAVLELLLAEHAEQKGRFIDDLIDGVWHIVEETTWVVPAHCKTPVGEAFPLSADYGQEVKQLDLFSAATGATLAWVYTLGKDYLEAVSPVLTERIIYELNRRIIEPFMCIDEYWWTGFSGRRVNNWTPWIVSNVLTVCALCVEDDALRERLAARSLLMLDNFTAGYLPDGGCDEGPMYWTAAGASYFDALEILYDMTGGTLDVFDVPFVRKVGEYIMSVHIHDDYFIPFADAHLRLKLEYVLAARFGRRTGSAELERFGISGYNRTGLNPLGISVRLTTSHPYRSIKNLYDAPVGDAVYSHPLSVWLDGIQVMVQRQNSPPGKGLFLAVKAGNNAEQHNHNDVGNFIVYADGEPLIIDVGVGTYCKATFGSERYSIWSMRSSYHNLPDINGFEQPPGKKYAASKVVFNDADRSIKMDLTAAYPPEAGLEKYIRTVTLSDERIQITDQILLYGAGDIGCNILLIDAPTLTESGTVMLRDGYALVYDPSLSAAVEAIALTDEGLRNDWQREQLYRLRFTVENTTTGVYAFDIRRV